MLPELPIDADLVLRHVQDSLLIVDTDCRILWTNESFRRMVGREDEDLVGRRCQDLRVGSFCGEHCVAEGAGESSCSTGAHFNVQVDGHEGRGEAGSYCFVSSEVKDSEGRVIGYMENFRGMDRVRDVIMQLEQVTEAIDAERQVTEDLINSLADGVISVNPDLTIRRFTPNMERMLGVSAADAIGRPCREVLRGTLCDTDCPLVWARENGQPVSGCREQLTTADGRRLEVAISTGALTGSSSPEGGLFAVVTDRSELEMLRREHEGRSSFHGLLGGSPAMQSLYGQIDAVAATEATVLIQGESGTGKELVARALHELSPRSKGPFVGVNCAALTETLLESELFGHLRGSFTGAVKDRRGRFEQANGGTLFLDEIGDTSPALQAKLLRAVQERMIEPVGSEGSRRVDVRIVAATNRDLREDVRNGTFREDLYYRLNVIPIAVPALRERPEDVPLLVDHFVEKYRAVHGFGESPDGQAVSERALALMQSHPWPGNVRELEHAVEYALITGDGGRIVRAFLPAPVREGSPSGAVVPPPVSASPEPAGETESAEERERREIVAALEANHWVIGKTASSLGVSRTTLWRHMQRFDLHRT